MIIKASNPFTAVIELNSFNKKLADVMAVYRFEAAVLGGGVCGKGANMKDGTIRRTMEMVYWTELNWTELNRVESKRCFQCEHETKISLNRHLSAFCIHDMYPPVNRIQIGLYLCGVFTANIHLFLLCVSGVCVIILLFMSRIPSSIVEYWMAIFAYFCPEYT